MSVKHIIISGRVQGVGFRQYVLREATKLELRGWVRNLSDGSVEVQVELTSSTENVFMDSIRRGPPLARVDQIVVNNKDLAPQSLSTFEILPDGRN